MPSSVECYEVLGPIGSGTFATCKKVRRKKDGKVLVWKEIEYSRLSEAAKQMLVLEVNLLRELRHDNIVRYYDRVIDKTRSTLYIIMEYCEAGDLASYIRKMKTSRSQVAESFVWQVCHQMASALHECHSRSRNGDVVLHRDLKPANIFLDAQHNVKIGDFGLARVLKPDVNFTKTCVGTPYYMSPEQLTGVEYNDKSDVWSLGCILYELCTLSPPFTADSHLALVNNVTSGQLRRIPTRYSDDLFALISALLQVNHSKRLSVEELLSHPLLLARFFPSRPDNTLTRPLQPPPPTNDGDRTARDAELEARELRVSQRETELEKRSAELDAREKRLRIREKMTDERMARAERLLEEYAEAKLALLNTAAITNHRSERDDDNDECGDSHCSSSSNPADSHNSRDSHVSSKAGQKSHHTGWRRRGNPTSFHAVARGIPASRENRTTQPATKHSACCSDSRSPLGVINQRDNLVVLGQRALPPVSSACIQHLAGYLGK